MVSFEKKISKYNLASIFFVSKRGLHISKNVGIVRKRHLAKSKQHVLYWFGNKVSLFQYFMHLLVIKNDLKLDLFMVDNYFLVI